VRALNVKSEKSVRVLRVSRLRMSGEFRALSVESVRALKVKSLRAVRMLRVNTHRLRMSAQCRGLSVGTVRAVSAERIFERDNENVMYLHIFRCKCPCRLLYIFAMRDEHEPMNQPCCCCFTSYEHMLHLFAFVTRYKIRDTAACFTVKLLGFMSPHRRSISAQHQRRFVL
jgi:hypothetical protein